MTRAAFTCFATTMVCHLQILVSRAYVRCGVKRPAPDTTSDVSPIKILVGVGSLFVRGLVVHAISVDRSVS